MKFDVSGLRSYAEIWVDGVIVDRLVTANGPFSVELPLATGSHVLTLYSPAVHEADKKNFRAEFSPDPSLMSADAIGGVALGANGESVKCKASWESKNGENILIFSAGDTGRKAIRFEITPQQIAAWMDGGFQILYLENGGARLVIRLDQVGPGWFSKAKDISRYVFALNPLNGGSAEIAVSAQTASGEKAAHSLTGVRLVMGGHSIEIRKSGTY